MGDEVLEEALAAAAAGGDAWALRALYEDLAPRVTGYLTARGASDPEDLTSEVFLAVFPRLSKVTGGLSGLRSFTFTVAHARLVDDLRRRARRPEPVGYDPERDTRTSPSAEDEAIAGTGNRRAIELLSKLPEDQRDVLLLRTLADLTVDQVADALGKSRGAVKQAQRRGLLTLRALLVAEGVTP
jgi:RNA polymerase sigma-70 factor (ECF subfamily)